MELSQFLSRRHQTDDENADVTSMLNGFSAVIKMDSDASS